MAKTVIRIFFGVLIFQHIIAAPSDVKLEDIAEVTQDKVSVDKKTEPKPETLLEEAATDGDTAPQSQRQKRWYNFYGFPPVNPSFFNRDDSLNTGVFGLQDPLFHIHRRLQDISNTFRQPPLPQFPPPSLPNFPSFVPVFYIPPPGCSCTPDETTQRPFENKPTPQDNNKQNETNPDIFTRWPDMEDERQNWGIVTNENTGGRDNNNSNGNNNDGNVEEDDGDGSRPISFEPIRPMRPMARPPPPVEHGSVQGDVNSGNADTTTTTIRPAQPTRPQVPRRPPQTTNRPLPIPDRPAQAPGLQPPSNCDSAILKCCLLPQVTYDCFALQGCPDPSAYGYPCDDGVISRVIDRFLRFYSQRNG